MPRAKAGRQAGRKEGRKEGTSPPWPVTARPQGTKTSRALPNLEWPLRFSLRPSLPSCLAGGRTRSVLVSALIRETQLWAQLCRIVMGELVGCQGGEGVGALGKTPDRPLPTGFISG